MKIFLIFLSLVFFGCGPQQTSRERDQDAFEAEREAQRAALAPYVGNYKGPVTALTPLIVNNKVVYDNNKKPIYNSYEGALNLYDIDSNTANPNRLENTASPDIMGSFKLCKGSGCFTLDTNNTTDAKQYIFTKVATSTKTSVSLTNVYNNGPVCLEGGGGDCQIYTLELTLTPTGVVGTLKNPNTGSLHLELTRQ